MKPPHQTLGCQPLDFFNVREINVNLIQTADNYNYLAYAHEPNPPGIEE